MWQWRNSKEKERLKENGWKKETCGSYTRTLKRTGRLFTDQSLKVIHI